MIEFNTELCLAVQTTTMSLSIMEVCPFSSYFLACFSDACWILKSLRSHHILLPCNASAHCDTRACASLISAMSCSGYYYGKQYPSLGQAIFVAVTVPILATWGGGWGGYSPGYWGGGYRPGARIA